MASVRVSYRFADGDELTAEVRTSDSYPDSLNQAVKEALNAFGTALTYSQRELTEGDDE